MNEIAVKQAFEKVKEDIEELKFENKNLHREVLRLNRLRKQEEKPYHNANIYEFLKENKDTAFNAREIAGKFKISYPIAYGRLNYLTVRGFINKEKTGYYTWFVYRGKNEKHNSVV